MQPSQAFRISGRSLAGCLLVATLLVIAASQLSRAHELPKLSELMASTRIEELKEVNERQKRLVEMISKIYGDEDELHDKEARLLSRVGVTRPNGHQKGELGRMYNTHLLNMSSLRRLQGELTRQVAESLEQQRQAEGIAEAA